MSPTLMDFFLRRGFAALSLSAVDGIIHSALPTTRRCRLQLLRVLYWKSLKRRAGLPLLRFSSAGSATLGGVRKLGRDLCDQPVILGQTEQIVDVVLFAPRHQIVACKPRIRPQQNAYLGPAPADLPTDPRPLFNRARAGVDIGPAQLGAKQVPPAKNIQRQVTIGFVVAMKEAPFLLAMQRIIGGVEIEGDLARRRPMRLEKQIDE